MHLGRSGIDRGRKAAKTPQVVWSRSGGRQCSSAVQRLGWVRCPSGGAVLHLFARALLGALARSARGTPLPSCCAAACCTSARLLPGAGPQRPGRGRRGIGGDVSWLRAERERERERRSESDAHARHASDDADVSRLATLDARSRPTRHGALYGGRPRGHKHKPPGPPKPKSEASFCFCVYFCYLLFKKN